MSDVETVDIKKALRAALTSPRTKVSRSATGPRASARSKYRRFLIVMLACIVVPTRPSGSRGCGTDC